MWEMPELEFHQNFHFVKTLSIHSATWKSFPGENLIPTSVCMEKISDNAPSCELQTSSYDAPEYNAALKSGRKL